MDKFSRVLVVTHVVYKNGLAIEGPYSSVCSVFLKHGKVLITCQLPLIGFSNPIRYGKWGTEKHTIIPSFLGAFQALKYLTDILITLLFVIKYSFRMDKKKFLVVGVDPLSCFALALFKKILGYRLVFYSVDFNRHRFSSGLMQLCYEFLDRFSSQQSDIVWVVCETLQVYKKKNYSIDSFYVPNSSIFSQEPYDQGKNKRSFDKLAWTGSCITERQFNLLFETLSQLHKKFPYLKLYLAPISNKEKFIEYIKKYNLNQTTIVNLSSRSEWQYFAATCDVGIAVYDDKFGSTEFIEPIKIWDYMMVGIPFIISCEPSLSTEVCASGAALLLEKGNRLPSHEVLKIFFDKKNLKAKQSICLELAKKYDIERMILRALG